MWALQMSSSISFPVSIRSSRQRAARMPSKLRPPISITEALNVSPDQVPSPTLVSSPVTIFWFHIILLRLQIRLGRGKQDLPLLPTPRHITIAAILSRSNGARHARPIRFIDAARQAARLRRGARLGSVPFAEKSEHGADGGSSRADGAFPVADRGAIRQTASR